MSFDEGENSVLDLLKLTGSLGGSKNGTCHTDRMQQDGGGWHNKKNNPPLPPEGTPME